MFTERSTAFKIKKKKKTSNRKQMPFQKESFSKLYPCDRILGIH